jgi:hypothetical protein
VRPRCARREVDAGRPGVDYRHRPEVSAFFDFHLANAARLGSEAGYLPLTETEHALAIQRAQARTPGTMFPEHELDSAEPLTSLLPAP